MDEAKESKLQVYHDDSTEIKTFLVDSSHDLSQEDIDFINGEIKYYYTYYNLEEHPEVTVVGKQVDGKICPIEELGSKVIFDGILDQKQTVKQYNNKIWIFGLVMFIGSALLMTWGGFRLKEAIELS